MDKEQRLVLATMSCRALLFLISQAARNLIEVLRIAPDSVGDDASAKEKSLHATEEHFRKRLQGAAYFVGNGEWVRAHERLLELVAECEERRWEFEREFKDQQFVEATKAKAERLAHLMDDEAVSKAPDGLEATSSVGEGQNGEGK